MAHEINNPLAYVSNNLAVIERDIRFLLGARGGSTKRPAKALAATQPDLVRQAGRLASEFDLDYVKENMGKILRSTRQGVTRVADIVQNLRGFARLDQAAVDQADVHEALRTAVEMLRAAEARPGATSLSWNAWGTCRWWRALAVQQLNQVFLNLLVNAMQAIESTHRDDGRIAITTEAHGDEIMVEVADNGCGIADENLPQIFDPFFTTKDVGDGTGLGLSITHSMVQDHGGRLEVESVPGQGTCFRASSCRRARNAVARTRLEQARLRGYRGTERKCEGRRRCCVSGSDGEWVTARQSDESPPCSCVAITVLAIAPGQGIRPGSARKAAPGPAGPPVPWPGIVLNERFVALPRIRWASCPRRCLAKVGGLQAPYRHETRRGPRRPGAAGNRARPGRRAARETRPGA